MAEQKAAGPARGVNIELGDIVRDKITGFEGVAIGRLQWLHGCERIYVQSKELKDNKPIDPVAFDMPQLQFIERPGAAATSTDPTREKPGGPDRGIETRRPDATRR